ncbi:hypothetical protein A9Q99_16630 [Gammaproteobacteria bacterium 45_16_T64]|nr:hypothetical protein A9Q99_16630 [Gammaproteobacteria bacterium 45_16_T64]
MAILWQKEVGDTRYEVRSAGKTCRLYTNGVLHSQYNPSQVITGSVWDLLLLPAFCVPEQQVKRVLVLGVGGGAVLHQLNSLLSPEIIIGVELSEEHLYIAKKFFGLTKSNVVLHRADAVSWLKAYQGPPFDLIIDDLYGDDGGEPVRAVALTRSWVTQLLSHLGREGVLVVNTVSGKELAASSLMVEGVMEQHFSSAFRFATPLCHNAVGAFFKSSVVLATLRQRIVANAVLEKAERSGLLKYTTRKLL